MNKEKGRRLLGRRLRDFSAADTKILCSFFGLYLFETDFCSSENVILYENENEMIDFCGKSIE